MKSSLRILRIEGLLRDLPGDGDASEVNVESEERMVSL